MGVFCSAEWKRKLYLERAARLIYEDLLDVCKRERSKHPKYYYEISGNIKIRPEYENEELVKLLDGSNVRFKYETDRSYMGKNVFELDGKELFTDKAEAPVDEFGYLLFHIFKRFDRTLTHEWYERIRQREFDEWYRKKCEEEEKQKNSAEEKARLKAEEIRKQKEAEERKKQAEERERMKFEQLKKERAQKVNIELHRLKEITTTGLQCENESNWSNFLKRHPLYDPRLTIEIANYAKVP